MQKINKLNKFNIKNVKDGDVLVYEFVNFQNREDIQIFLKELKNTIPKKVTLVAVPAGEFLSLKTEKEMNELGWYRASKGNKIATLLK